MRAWLKTLWRRFAAWRAENEQKLADAPVSACCSHPPPGGRQ